LKDVGVDERIILKWIFNKMGRCGLDSSGSGQSVVVSFCEYDNESSSSLGDGEFLH
jgi:hypothetical protein